MEAREHLTSWEHMMCLYLGYDRINLSLTGLDVDSLEI
jgi:hypothetical protein